MREHKDELTLANAGPGSSSHLCGMLFQSAVGVPLTTVPYKGTAPAMTDLLGGQVDLVCDQTTNTTGQIRSGKVKAYAVTTKDRVAALSDLPTLDEAGLPGFEMSVWHGLWAPAGTPPETIAKLTTALGHALEDPKVIERFADLGTVPVPASRGHPYRLAEPDCGRDRKMAADHRRRRRLRRLGVRTPAGNPEPPAGVSARPIRHRDGPGGFRPGFACAVDV